MKNPEALMSAIDVLEGKLRDHEKAATRYKQMINELCVDAGIDARYADAAADSHAASSIRSDRFHGLALATAVREYLEMRRAADLGPATVAEILGALKQGGYAFETKDDDNAKRGLRESLTKNTAFFYKLPNGGYGLRAWYPNIKEPKEIKVKRGRPAKATGRKQRLAAKSSAKAPGKLPTLKVLAGQGGPSKGGIVDDVVAILRESGQPMRIDQIVKSLLETKGRTTSPLPLSGQLSRFSKPGSPLRKEGKNLYGLAEWAKRPEGKAAM